MSLRFLRAAAWLAAILPVLASAASLTLTEAVERAVTRSEGARAARAGVTSASEAARAAGQLPDPMVGVSIENLPVTGGDRFSTTREAMTMKRLALSQEWVAADKRALRVAAANAAVARESAAAAAASAEARLQTALAFVDAWYAAEALKVAATNESHARESTDTAQARLASGSGVAQDVLALSSARGMAADESADARQQLASASANLVRWTGSAGGEFAAPALSMAVSEQAFVQAHPLVVTKTREMEVARQEAAVAASNRKPNWTWEIAYGQRTGQSDLVSFGVNIPWPISPSTRQDRDTASRLALADKAEAELNEALRTAVGEYRMLAGDAERLRQRIATYEADVITPASQRTSAARAAYGANQSNLAAVFEARHAELEAQRKLLQLRRDEARTLVQLTYKPVKAEELQ
jgi:outer membrane protein, heavy metal efflux system